MEVIFVENLDKIKAGTILTVKDGYARNYLFPKRLAVPATAENRAHLTEKLEEVKKRHEELLKHLNETKAKLEASEVVIERKSEQQDKIFGAVTGSDIWEELIKLGFQLEKHDIETPDLKKIGSYKVTVGLREEVKALLTVKIVAEK